MMGRTPAKKIRVFGSRAGSLERGPGPLPTSDLDVLIVGTPGLKGSRWEQRITDIVAEIDGTNLHGTKITLQINAGWKINVLISNINPPFVDI